jgi:hypothetical protein
MRLQRFLFVIYLLLLMGTFVVVESALAQSSATCPDVVNQAMNQIGRSCANMGRNTACYGFNDVSASFTESVDPNTFTRPDDRTAVNQLNHIRTSPFRLDDGTWGISLLNIQANLPNTLPGQGVVMVVFGGVEVENAVDPEEAFIPPATGITVNTAAQTNLLATQPIDGRSPAVVAEVPAGASVQADVTNPAGDWVRIVHRNYAGWVPRSALDSAVDLSGLTVMPPDAQTPMQSFFMRVGIGGLECENAPSSVMVQGPNGTPVDIQALGTDIRIQSTILLRTTPPGDQLGTTLELITVSGLAILYPDTPQQILVPPGYITTVPLGSFVSLGIEGDNDEKLPAGPWTPPRPLTQEELDEFRDRALVRWLGAFCFRTPAR